MPLGHLERDADRPFNAFRSESGLARDTSTLAGGLVHQLSRDLVLLANRKSRIADLINDCSTSPRENTVTICLVSRTRTKRYA